MANRSRQWLVQSLGRHLLPAFQDRGFELVPLTADQSDSREYRTAFPFGNLRRSTTHGIELVEVQLDKCGAAAFRLNFGVAPKGGVVHPLFGHVSEDDVNVHTLPVFYEAYSCPAFRRWFRVRRPWLGPPVSKLDIDTFVKSHLDLIDEVEVVLRGGRRGRHIRVADSWR